MASTSIAEIPDDILRMIFWPLPDKDLATATCVSKMFAKVGRDVLRYRSSDLYTKVTASSINLQSALESDALQVENLKVAGVPLVYESLEIQRCMTALTCAASVPLLGFRADTIPLYACRVFQCQINSLVHFRQTIVSSIFANVGIVLETTVSVDYV